MRRMWAADIRAALPWAGRIQKPGCVREEYIMLKLAVCDDEKVFRSDLKRILATELELCGID